MAGKKVSAVQVLALNEVSFKYGRREIISSLSMQLPEQSSAAVMGKTGSGKSTILACIAGLMKPSAGDVVLLGESLPKMSSRQLARYRRRHLGVVFQSGELLPALTPLENVALPAMLDGVPWHRAADTAAGLLHRLEVPPADVAAMSLSGGERTRVAIARALINQPELVLADEPTGALDTETRDAVTDLLYTIPAYEGCALLVVTHDEAVAARADAAYRLADGQLVPMATLAQSS